MMKTKFKDERVEAEKNRIYKIGFYIFTVGMVLNFVVKAFFSTPEDIKFDRVDWGVFMLAQIVCLILFSRRGIYIEDPLSDNFRWKKHLLAYTGMGLLLGFLQAVSNRIRFNNTSTAGFMLTVTSMTVFVLLLGLTISGIAFAFAKHRREQQTEELESKEETE